MYKNLAILICVPLIFTGCGGWMTKKVDPQAYQSINIDAIEELPSKEMLEGKKPRAVVFKAEEKADLARKMSIGESLTGTIESYLAQGTEIIDRSLAQKLKEEIMLGELNGRSSGGPSLADFAVLSEITMSKWNKKFNEGRTYRDSDGNFVRIAPSCSYSANVAGNIKIYALPSMSVVETIKFTGTERSKEDSRHSHCPITDSQIGGLLAEAAVNAVDTKRTQIQNVFAPMGYITERRTGEDGDIFRVSLGSSRGVAPGDKVSITRKVRVHTQLGGETTEIVRLGEASIADPVENTYSWVFVDDEELANKLKIGDSVKLVYEAGLLEAGLNFIKK